MKTKIYKLFSSATRCGGQSLFALALIVFSDAIHSQTTYTFNYTGSTQTISLPAGNYSIECWGADGGDATNGTIPMPGGKGGYSKGFYTNPITQTINVYVGGHGGNGSGTGSIGGGGGGMSDITTATNTNVILIAAGGGGGATSGAGNEASTGGFGGGLTGGSAIDGSAVDMGVSATGGSQTAGGFGVAGSYGVGSPGGYGYGGGSANGTAGPVSPSGTMHAAGGIGGNGGNGGWNGGGAGSTGTNGNNHSGGGGAGYYGGGGGIGDGGAGGGGSGYVGGLTSGTTVATAQPGFVTNPDVTGNGRVLITELCNITLSHNGAGTPNVAQLCSGQSLTLTTNAISNYSWSTGDVTSSLVVSPTSNTVYGLTATSPSNCTSSAQISIIVSGAVPVLSVSQSTNQTCLGKTATLTASGAVTYTWTNGVTNGVSFFPSVTNEYTVTGQNGCGITTAVSTISVNPLPVSVVSTGTAVCTNKTATLSVTAAATSYTWQPNNSMGTSTSVIVNPQANTIYTVTASDGTCSGVANISLQANPAPTITASSSSSVVCPGGAATLSVTGGNNYTWSPTNQNGNSITVTPTASTLYSVIGDNNFGCFNTSTKVIVLGSIPNFVLNASATSICLGNTSTLTVNNATATYVWSNGPTGNTNVVSPTQNTTYTVIATNPASNCSDEKSVAVTVYEPMVSITGNTAVCNGQEISLSATAAGATGYTWNPGGPFQTINTVPPATMIYTVSTNSSSNNISCPVQGTFQVTVNPIPTLTVSAEKTAVCKNETNTLTASGAASYIWTNGTTTLSANSITITSAVPAILVYSVTGKDAAGCEATVSMPLTISACVGLDHLSSDQSQLTIYPNPNNGEFTIQGSADMDLKLVNQLGQVIKHIQIGETNDRKVYVTGLSNGIYFIVGENLTRKILINK